jgi:hypothetical protein
MYGVLYTALNGEGEPQGKGERERESWFTPYIYMMCFYSVLGTHSEVSTVRTFSKTTNETKII